MDNIIDNSAFYGKLLIPNANEETGVTGIVVKKFIDENQEYFLRNILGNELYEDFAASYDGMDDTSRWYAVLNGVTFKPSNYCPSIRWFGLPFVLARYVYCEYQKNEVTQSVDGGEVITDTQNAGRAYVVAKFSDAWNVMARQLSVLKEYMDIEFKDDEDWQLQSSALQGSQFLTTINPFGI